MVVPSCITEIEGGSVFFDQVDAAKIGTTTLCFKLSIIPQAPVIFSNTVHYNPYPFETCSGKDILRNRRSCTFATIVVLMLLYIDAVSKSVHRQNTWLCRGFVNCHQAIQKSPIAIQIVFWENRNIN
jgi:hypothetical protein